MSIAMFVGFVGCVGCDSAPAWLGRGHVLGVDVNPRKRGLIFEL
jgi:hypothetical protein